MIKFCIRPTSYCYNSITKTQHHDDGDSERKFEFEKKTLSDHEMCKKRSIFRYLSSAFFSSFIQNHIRNDFCCIFFFYNFQTLAKKLHKTYKIENEKSVKSRNLRLIDHHRRTGFSFRYQLVRWKKVVIIWIKQEKKKLQRPAIKTAKNC